MIRRLLLLLAVASCAKKRIPECDAFAAIADKVAACETIPSETRQAATASAESVRQAMKLLEDAGGANNAPSDILSSVRDACRTQEITLREHLTEKAPGCAK